MKKFVLLPRMEPANLQFLPVSLNQKTDALNTCTVLLQCKWIFTILCSILISFTARTQTLYGTTEEGHIFKADVKTQQLTYLYYYSGASNLFAGPDNKLYDINGSFSFDPATLTMGPAGIPGVLQFIGSDGLIYAKTSNALFSYDPFSRNVTTIDNSHDFGFYNLIQASNGKLYGITSTGGLYSFDLNSKAYVTVDSTDNFGEFVMQATNGILYGISRNAGPGNPPDGELYSYDLATGIYTEIFIPNSDVNGTNPEINLVQLPDGKLYCRMANEGYDHSGTLLSFDPVTLAFRGGNFNLSERAFGGVTAASDGNVYLVMYEGGFYSSFIWPTGPLLTPEGEGPYFSRATLVELRGCNISASASAGSILCSGDSTIITAIASGGTAPYQYSIDNGTYQASASFKVGAGSYTISVKDAGGCNKTLAPITVIEPSAINFSTVVNPIGSNKAVVTVNASGGTAPYLYTINDRPYQTSNSFTLSAGTYRFVVKDSNGCIKSVTMVVISPSRLSISFTGEPIRCYGGVSTYTIHPVGGIAPYSYKVNNGAFQSSNMYTVGAGQYTVTVKDAVGSTVTMEVRLAQPRKLDITTSFDKIKCQGGFTKLTVKASGGKAPYTYSVNGGSFTANNKFEGLTAGSYLVAVKDAKGCDATITLPIADGLNSCNASRPVVGKPPVEALSLEVKAVPNPSHSAFTLHVRSKSNDEIKLTVTDVVGRILVEKKGSSNDQYNFGNSFTKGIYFIIVSQGTNSKTIRVVKE